MGRTVIEKWDVILSFDSKDWGAVISSSETNRFAPVVEDDPDEGGGGLCEFEQDSSVDIEGVGVVEVVGDEDEGDGEEGPVADDLGAARDALKSHLSRHGAILCQWVRR